MWHLSVRTGYGLHRRQHLTAAARAGLPASTRFFTLGKRLITNSRKDPDDCAGTEIRPPAPISYTKTIRKIDTKDRS